MIAIVPPTGPPPASKFSRRSIRPNRRHAQHRPIKPLASCTMTAIPTIAHGALKGSSLYFHCLLDYLNGFECSIERPSDFLDKLPSSRAHND